MPDPPGPGEVADHVRELAHELPVAGDLRRVGLAADDHTLGVQVVVHRVARFGVVVPGHVEVRERLRGLLVDDLLLEEHRKPLLEHGHHRVDAHLRRDRRCTTAFAAPEGREEVWAACEHVVDRVGDDAGVVEAADALADGTADARARRVAGVGDLVADRVHDHRRVVAVLAHHGVDIGFPPVGEHAAVVVVVLLLGPHVERLVHDEHPEAIAGVEHLAAHRVVRAAQRVEPRVLEDLHPSFVGARDGRSTDHAVVMVDARAAQLDRLAVDA